MATRIVTGNNRMPLSDFRYTVFLPMSIAFSNSNLGPSFETSFWVWYDGGNNVNDIEVECFQWVVEEGLDALDVTEYGTREAAHSSFRVVFVVHHDDKTLALETLKRMMGAYLDWKRDFGDSVEGT